MRKLLLLSMLLLTAFAPAWATEIEIGTRSTAVTALPMYPRMKYNVTQQIYTAAEIGQPGTISSISFYCEYGEEDQTRNFDLYFVHTSMSGFTESRGWVSCTPSDLVFSGAVTFSASGWTTIKLDSPFDYDGSRNLAVIVKDITGTWGEYYEWAAYSATDGSLYAGSDSESFDVFNLSNVWGNLYDYKNCIKLDIDVVVSEIPTYTYYDYSLSQQIYTPSEVGGAGSITSIAFPLSSSDFDSRTRNFNVYLVPTSKSSFAGGDDWVSFSDADKVFSGDATFSPGGKLEFPLSKPFSYDGKQNLAVIVCDMSNRWANAPHPKFLGKVAEGQCIYAYRDGAPFASTDLNTLTGNKSNIKNPVEFTLQTAWQVGSGTSTSWTCPIHSSYYSSISHQIYTASEMKGAASITSLSFYCTRNADTRNLDIYLVHTDKDYFSSSDEWLPLTEDDIVFSGPVAFTENEWTAIPLARAFAYDGTHHLGVVVCDRTGTKGNEMYFLCYYSYTGGSSKDYGYMFGPIIDPLNFSGATISNFSRNQIRFNDAPVEPKLMGLRATATLTSATVSWKDEGTQWEYQLAKQSEDYGASQLTGTKNLVLTGLTPQTSYKFRVRSTSASSDEWAETTFSTFLRPTSINVTDITYQSATVTWESEGTMWNVSYGPTTGDGWITLQKFPAKSITLNGLQEGTWYEVRVEVVDADGNTGSVRSDSFQTLEKYPRPDGLSADKVGQTYAVLDWTENSGAKAWEIMVNDEDDIRTTTRRPYTLTGLEPGTRYEFRVRSVLPDGTTRTRWSDYEDFYTEGPGHALPSDFSVKPGTTSATIAWSGNSDTYELRYRKSNFALVEDFEGLAKGETLPAGWKAIDADGDEYGWGLTDFSEPHSGDYVMASASWWDGEALTPDNWLVISEVELGGILSAWLRGYGTYDHVEHFAFYVSTTGTNPSDFKQVSQEYVTTNRWQPYSADLSAYVGKKGYVAIRHFNCTDQYVLLVDDISISKGGAGYQWQTVETTAMQAKLTGLEKGATYEFQIIGHAQSFNDVESVVQYFSTLTEAPVPSDFAVTATASTARITWSGENQTYLVQYRKSSGRSDDDDIIVVPTPKDDEEPWKYAMTSTAEVTLTGLEKETDYEFKVVGYTTGEANKESEVSTFSTTGDLITLALDAQDENRNAISDADGALANVVIQNLTIKGDGSWQTLCLPFDVDVENSSLAGSDVRTLESARVAGNLVVLNCLTPVTTMKANTPYLIRRSGMADVSNPIFMNVVIDYGEPHHDGIGVSYNRIYFSGQYYYEKYSPYEYDYTLLYHLDGSTILSHGDVEIPAFSGYFWIDDEILQQCDTFVLNTGTDDTMTGVSLAGEEREPSIYEQGSTIVNLAGQRIGRLQKGINIVNGRKVLVK